MKESIKYQVFVSSTYEDLKEERKEITQAILESDCIPIGMEMFPASNKTQWEVIKSVIDESDIYLVIIAGRYGSEGNDENGKRVSYTEMEFDYALKTGKPIIALVYEDIGLLPRSKCETSETKNKKLKKFIEKVRTGRMIKKWSNKDNMKSAALTALADVKESEKGKMSGWIPYKNAAQYENLAEENEKNIKKVQLLESQLTEMQKGKKSVYGRQDLMEYCQKLEKIIYKGYFNHGYMENNEDVDEIIGNVELNLAIKYNHQE